MVKIQRCNLQSCRKKSLNNRFECKKGLTLKKLTCHLEAYMFIFIVCPFCSLVILVHVMLFDDIDIVHRVVCNKIKM